MDLEKVPHQVEQSDFEEMDLPYNIAQNSFTAFELFDLLYYSTGEFLTFLVWNGVRRGCSWLWAKYLAKKSNKVRQDQKRLMSVFA